MNTPTMPGPPGGDDQEQPWLQRVSEPNLWYSRFTDFLLQGPARSVQAAYNAEKSRNVKGSQAKTKTASRAWYDASRRFDWSGRAEAYDAHLRKTLLASGNAMDTERIKKLDRLIEGLSERIEAMLATAAPEQSFNEKLVAQYLTAIDLMSKHTGSYAAIRHEITGKDGGKIEVEETRPQVVFYMPEVDFGQLTRVEEVVDSSPTETTKDNNNA